jgi:PTH1 family peptidyl-tRNA hydrolase
VSGSTDPWLVVGLGNPGPSYATTRHNVGYRVVDLLAERIGGSWRRHRSGRADAVEGRLGPPGSGPSPRVIVMRPRTYMNESGGPVAAVASYASVPAERVIAVHDELDLPFGEVRAKFGGGTGGHNGLRSLQRSLGTADFGRVRVGIGRPPGRQDPADFVLSPYTVMERREIDLHVEVAADVVASMILRGLAITQSSFHGREKAT